MKCAYPHRMRLCAILVAAVLVPLSFLAAQTSAPVGKPKPFEPLPPPEQPLPFSHKVHVGLGLECLDCHKIEDPGFLAGYPSTSTCMACHAAVRTDSPHIQRLSGFEEEGKEIPWVKVYKVPDYVYFSHEWHHKEAKISCQECHGPVAEREVIFQEKPTNMMACMACHDRRKASNECNLCHDAQ